MTLLHYLRNHCILWLNAHDLILLQLCFKLNGTMLYVLIEMLLVALPNICFLKTNVSQSVRIQFWHRWYFCIKAIHCLLHNARGEYTGPKWRKTKEPMLFWLAHDLIRYCYVRFVLWFYRRAFHCIPWSDSPLIPLVQDAGTVTPGHQNRLRAKWMSPHSPTYAWGWDQGFQMTGAYYIQRRHFLYSIDHFLILTAGLDLAWNGG